MLSVATKSATKAALATNKVFIRRIYIPSLLHELRHSNTLHQTLHRRDRPHSLPYPSRRMYTKHNWKRDQYNIIKREGQSAKDYLNELETLIFRQSRRRVETFWLWSPCIIVVLAGMQSIWNWMYQDHEIRITLPHRTSHSEQERTEHAKKEEGQTRSCHRWEDVIIPLAIA